MKDQKSTKTYVDNDRVLLSQIKNHINDSYYFDVIYYYFRRALIKLKFNLGTYKKIEVNGRYFGYDTNIVFSIKCNSILKSLGAVLSIRAFMLNKEYIKWCYNDKLLFYDIETGILSWGSHLAIMECIKDEDFRQIYQMIVEYKEWQSISNEQKEIFITNTIRPDYQSAESYLRLMANNPERQCDYVIENNAFLCSDLESFEIPDNIEYIGDTAFAYCENLHTLKFTNKVYFGYFPIIECNNLKQIVVPTDLIDYYKEKLPYYKDIISDEEKDIPNIIEEELQPDNKEAQVVDEPKAEDSSEIEIVYVDVNSADPYTEIEVGSSEADEPEEEDIDAKIDTDTLKSIFDNKSTSYKYFWFQAIISLVKETGYFSITFKEIVIRMASLAWPIVFDYDISLGKTDKIPETLEKISKKTKLIHAASSKVVENHLRQHYQSQGIDKLLTPLLKDVPYRFLSPWVKYTTDDDVRKTSNRRSFTGLYALQENNIILNEDWWEYIDSHYLEVCDFAMRSFISYVKKYNNDMKLVKLMTTGWQLIKNK